MKIYILFKVKDMTKKKKEFIVDSVYTDVKGAVVREDRLHSYNRRGRVGTPSLREMARLNLIGKLKGSTLIDDYQQTYIINKTLKGLCRLQTNKDIVWYELPKEMTNND